MCSTNILKYFALHKRLFLLLKDLQNNLKSLSRYKEHFRMIIRLHSYFILSLSFQILLSHFPRHMAFYSLVLPSRFACMTPSSNHISKVFIKIYIHLLLHVRSLLQIFGWRLYCKRAVKSPSQYYCCFLHWWWSKIDTFLSWKTFFDLDGGNCTLFE